MIGTPEPQARLIGYIGLVLFGGSTAIVLLTRLRPAPVLVLDEAGLEIRTSPFGTARLAWDDIDHLVVRRVFRERMLGIVPKDGERWLAAHSPAARALTQANRSFGAPFWVAESTLPGTCADLARLIQGYRPLEVVWLD
ncbi:MAG TPA: STM3941 family protein [Thermaerobacter sp.]